MSSAPPAAAPASARSARTGYGTRRRPSCCAPQAPLAEIGQLLRHRLARTTAIYAKVDDDALRQLAQPWPENRS